jgi:lysine 6-dehydrogenase
MTAKGNNMKILVLGGCGIQGRTAIYDLSKEPDVEEILCADTSFEALDKIREFTDMSKVTTISVDSNDRGELINLFKQADLGIDLLPKGFTDNVCRAAIAAKKSVLNSNYGFETLAFHEQAIQNGIAIMPECGLDPGIDLVLYAHARRFFDKLEVVNSYCGGVPEKAACNNPLDYKISWIWSGVLGALNRNGRIMRDKQIIDIPSEFQNEAKHIHMVDFPGLGALEASINGDAVFFTDMIGVTDTIRDTGRYTLRWPGWNAFWDQLKKLGFLNEIPVKGLPGNITSFDFLDKLLAPQLQYARDEKDVVAMLNIFEGIKDGKKMRLTSTITIERDLETGLLGMSLGVGYPISIVALMIGRGEINQKGVLSPAKDIPVDNFLAELQKRGITIKEELEVIT